MGCRPAFHQPQWFPLRPDHGRDGGSFLDERVTPGEAGGTTGPRHDAAESRITGRRFSREVVARQHDPFRVHGEQSPGHTHHGDRLTAADLDASGRGMPERDAHHLPHPGMNIEAAGKPPGQFWVGER